MNARSGGHAELGRHPASFDGRLGGVGYDNGMCDAREPCSADDIQPVVVELLIRQMAVCIDKHGRRIAN